VGVPHGIRVVRDDDFATLHTSRKYATLEDIYVAIGRDDMPIETAVEHLVPLLQQRGDIPPALKAKEIATEAKAEVEQLMLPAPLDNKSGANWNPALVKLAHCCYPIPGDVIVGIFQHKCIFTKSCDYCYIGNRSCRSNRSHLQTITAG